MTEKDYLLGPPRSLASFRSCGGTSADVARSGSFCSGAGRSLLALGAPRSRLTRLQTDVLGAFFQREQGFYLTGGGALAGYHLGHRETHDLDLFTLFPATEDGLRALRDTARELGASLEEIRTAPEFRRILLSRGNESVVVDLVVEHAEQVSREKPAHGVVRVDPAAVRGPL